MRAHADRQRRRDHRRQRQRHHAVLARHVLVHVAARRGAGRRRRSTWPASPTSRAGSTRSASDVITDEGYFYHKYNPDGSPASIVAPVGAQGQRSRCRSRRTRRRWSCGRCGGTTTATATSSSSARCGSTSCRRPPTSWCRYRDARTGLPLPSYDLWEERWGVHAFTVATVYGGLKAARNFAVCFGDRDKRRDLQQGRRGDQGRRGEVPVQREAQPLRPPARPEGHADAAGRAATYEETTPLEPDEDVERHLRGRRDARRLALRDLQVPPVRGRRPARRRRR